MTWKYRALLYCAVSAAISSLVFHDLGDFLDHLGVPATAILLIPGAAFSAAILWSLERPRSSLGRIATAIVLIAG